MFGPQCSLSCHCKDGVLCHHIDGSCPGGCAAGYKEDDCQKGEFNVCMFKVVFMGQTQLQTCLDYVSNNMDSETCYNQRFNKQNVCFDHAYFVNEINHG